MHFVILTDYERGLPIRIDLDKVQSYHTISHRTPPAVGLSFGAYAFPSEHQRAAIDLIEVREDIETLDRLVGVRQGYAVYNAEQDLRVPLLPGDGREVEKL